MKFLVFGLGNFGGALAIQLTNLGHEVIGIYKREDKVLAIKDRITYAINLDSTRQDAMQTLPLSDTDTAIVCIGEDEGSAMLTTALLKQFKIKRIISRAISPLHQIILEAMGVDELVHPEEDSADRLARRLDIKGLIESFHVGEDYKIAEIIVPSNFVGRTVFQAGFPNVHPLTIITIIRTEKEANTIGSERRVHHIVGVVNQDTMLKEGDLLVLFGRIRDIEKLSEM
ncbi:MAG: TrkA family potassium uptake protein [Saprospiraceae bacterium]|nr:TrkA family potassium uptake protein [Saprospiraceae bacterium]